ncbi:MAG: hypothetical protein FJY51_08010 [Betaproteobacteria bacterium]|nr:hypothetical protein [Betaproteobacteria bacterium]
MSDELKMDEVTDLIASIEMHRKEIERESGLDASRTYALRRLNQALQEEQEAAKQESAGPVHAAAAELFATEVRRVSCLSRSSARRPAQGQNQNPPQQQQQRNFRPGGHRPQRKPGGGRRNQRRGGGR